MDGPLDLIPTLARARHATIVVLLGIAGVLALTPGGARAADEPSGATPALSVATDAGEDYDPWAPFNQRMFSFNHGVVDRFVVKPAATAWGKVCPDAVKRGVGRAIDNVKMPRRVVNNLLQGRVQGAGVEAGRFVINTTVGVGGFLDVAKQLHIDGSEADMGETLGVWGLGPGPYLVLPFMAPLTVRDGFGRVVDAVLDPLWLVPFFGGTAMNLVNTVNERSLHLRFFADVEESSLDLYSSVRNGYLQRRRHVVASRQASRQRAPVLGAALASPESGG
jgi:phospholipid-binding lipoprotein MlaA